MPGPQLQALKGAQSRSGPAGTGSASAAGGCGHEMPGGGRRIVNAPRLERVGWASHGPLPGPFYSATINLGADSPPRKLSQARAGAAKVEDRRQA